MLVSIIHLGIYNIDKNFEIHMENVQFIQHEQ